MDDDEEGLEIGEGFSLDMLQEFLLRGKETKEINNVMDYFKKIETNQTLLSKGNSLYYKINIETINIYTFLEYSINNFHKLFNENLNNFEDCIKYLEKIAIPNKCVCAGVIDNIPGWRCIDCSKYENTIYCNDCYKKSKEQHKNHKVVYLYSSMGMCDCGDPDSLIIFCSEHSGPQKEQKQINEFISKVFKKDILDKLNKFFNELFEKFSKYFILTEKLDYFYKSLFDQKFGNENLDFSDLNILNEKNDIELLKNNFCIVFQNLIHFLRLISQKNLSMLYLIANYFLKNHLENQKLEEEYMTVHSCIKITETDIKILNTDTKKHTCKCPFFRLFISNYREEINSIKNENEEFLISFSHNLPLRNAFCIIFFFIYKQIVLNNNEDIINNRNQFFCEDVTELIGKKTNLIEESYKFLYENLCNNFKSSKLITNSGVLNKELVEKVTLPVKIVLVDTKYFSRPKMLKLMTEKTSIVKKVIDCICLIHNGNEFKTIVPHPQFQSRGFSPEFFELECYLLNIIEEINLFIDWEKIESLKDIFNYLINKIINQKKEGIKQLKDDEYSFHLPLYRCFELLLNSFCFNYAFNHKCNLFDSIEFFKKTFFKTYKVEDFVGILLKDYCKLFGFVAGAKNNFFNYYDMASGYSNIYFLIKIPYLIDFSILKYLFVMSEKPVDINFFLKLSNIENVYSLFENVFLDGNKNKKIQDNLNIININNKPDEDKSGEEYNSIMQWRLLLDILIDFMKDDSCIYWTLMREYDECLSSITKKNLFNVVRNNKYAMEDLENILKEKLVHELIAKGNLVDMKKITKDFDKYLQTVFEKDNKFNKVLEELTNNKMNGETKMFYLKDTCLKYLDINNYFSFTNKSNAQRYILDFKKDIIKPYNKYYYNPSELTFDFHRKVYEKILKNKNNLQLMIKIVKKLLSDEKITENLDKKSVRNSLLPVVLNYLSMFSLINTKSLIEFKEENKKLLDELLSILSESLNNNKNNNILEKDLEENVKEIYNQIILYQIIKVKNNNDLTKLKKNNYNTYMLEIINNKLKENKKMKVNEINLFTESSKNQNDVKKEKSKNLKQKLKNLMKNKANIFMDKVSSNKEMSQAIKEENKKKQNDSNDEIMCFFCRNPIKLKSFQTPYGKTGLQIEDYFYMNTIKSTIKTELDKLSNNDNKIEMYNEIINNNLNDKCNRIISCGHYFHKSCFIEGYDKNSNKFVCPLCLKNQNILIPPLNHFHEKYSFLKSEKINKLFDKNAKLEKFVIDKDYNLFKDVVHEFLSNINFMNINVNNCNDYKSFLDYLYPNYKSYFNFLENIFYVDGTTFHKNQMIDNMQNLVLSLRFITKTNILDINQIIKYIQSELLALCSNQNKYIYNYNDKQMHYVNLFEKILLSLSILFDYDEMEEIFKYVLYIFLPYFSIGFYFRDLIFKKKFKKINEFKFNEKMNNKDLEIFLKDNNNQMLNYLKALLKKFLIIKLISDFNKKNEKIINSFNKLSLEELISYLDKDNFIKSLQKKEKKEINFIDIINNFHKILNTSDISYKLFNIDKILKDNFRKIFDSIFINIKKNNNEKSQYNMELIIQFSPLKFEFIYLDNNIFDWIERNIEKKCDICNKISKYSFICLICGNKVCKNNYFFNDIREHVKKCGGEYCLFVNMDNMSVVMWDYKLFCKKLFPIYVNKEGTGPQGNEMGNEFNLSHEKLNLAIKKYVCNDFHFND